jgi:hypothetical protein
MRGTAERSIIIDIKFNATKIFLIISTEEVGPILQTKITSKIKLRIKSRPKFTHYLQGILLSVIIRGGGNPHKIMKSCK